MQLDGQLDMFGGEVRENHEYHEFVDKFKPKKTTDDCYTPELVYEAVAGWVAEEYGLDRAEFVRPFWPGGDYLRYDYPAGCVVVDNPPFSIITRIMRFYCHVGIRFFLFAPTLTLFSGARAMGDLCYLPTGVQITYENGAQVNTSFATNLETVYRVRTSPELYQRVKAADDQGRRERTRELPKYSYPDHVLTAAAAYQLAKYGQELRIRRDECTFIPAMDAQRGQDKAIFGGAMLLGERAAAERAAATKWRLSAREMEIVKRLGGGKP